VTARREEVAVDVPLNDDEWAMLYQHLQWGGPARASDEAASLIGYESAFNLKDDVARLLALVRTRSPMLPRDWRRLLVSIELLFGSDTFGCGIEWATVTGIPDREAVASLRRLQRKLGDVARSSRS
jgi:hypothetical protein